MMVDFKPLFCPLYPKCLERTTDHFCPNRLIEQDNAVVSLAQFEEIASRCLNAPTKYSSDDHIETRHHSVLICTNYLHW